jgi:hypothetical protein
MEAKARSDGSAVLDFRVVRRALRQGVLYQASRLLPEWPENMAESIWGLDLYCNKPSGMNSLIAIETARLHENMQIQILRLSRVVKVAGTGIVTLSPRRF